VPEQPAESLVEFTNGQERAADRRAFTTRRQERCRVHPFAAVIHAANRVTERRPPPGTR
jgi:hypothetical protein